MSYDINIKDRKYTLVLIIMDFVSLSPVLGAPLTAPYRFQPS